MAVNAYLYVDGVTGPSTSKTGFIDVLSFSWGVSQTAVYGTGASGMRSLTWYDRQGKAIGTAAPPSGYLELSLSHAGSHVAAATFKGGAPDIWVYDLARGASTRLTNGPGRNARPVWSPDGNRIVFTSDRGGVFQLIIKPASGAGDERVLRTSKLTILANDWSHDGRLLLFEETDAKRKNHLWYLSMDGEPKPTQYLQDEFNERAGQFSPDHKFVAYVSDQSGGNEVYVSSFADANALRVPISHGGGTQPRWRQDGKELLYFSGDGNLMSVDVTLASIFKAGVPKVLFKAPIFEGGLSGGSAENWDVSPDGQRFLLNTIGGGSAPLTVELNWQAGLKK